ncbi:hypothetical protein [Acinetobacter lwoffii]|uniref:Uncharacterized protein n=1 Tax=Acinetobacter lwoffii TaxID=28090 RepID=A0A6N1MFH8_ACILW|nr:hypothetical protein [Acinetobacter lwoffii]QKU20663.1 hypothetical protein FOB19_03995 [Acinetobacter lwoffii]
MSKLIKKTSEVALTDIQNALAELRNCQDEIRKGLTAQVYVDMANNKLSKAIKHMLDAESWIDAIREAQVPDNDSH